MVPPLHLTDGYKVDHRRQYPKGTSLVYSNFTPRKSRIPGVNKVVYFGGQFLIRKYLIEEFNENFFKQPKEKVVKTYTRRINNYLPPGHSVTFEHVGALHDLGYLPLVIKSLPEGVRVPMRVPPFVVYNTLHDFYWLVNYFETLISCVLWPMCTSATTAFEYKKKLTKWSMKTVGNADFVPWQGHDFSFRGMFGPEAAQMSGAAHLTSFFGTDTIPAIDFLEKWYYADSDKEIVGGSVAATEHSVMCLGTGLYIWEKYRGDWSYQGAAEEAVFRRLITEVYPTGIISIVSDTWNLWRVLTEFLPNMKDVILARDGKLVIRPDSGDPVDILCGLIDEEKNEGLDFEEYEYKGVIQLLWEIFGGTTTEKGYKLLDSHVGAIYGDSITLDRAEQICSRLEDKKFASINTVLGIGSFTYQYVTRDTFGWAMKATYGEVETKDKIIEIPIFKDPITDDGTKKSARGLLMVEEKFDPHTFVLHDEVTREQETEGALEVVFENGEMKNATTLAKIRYLINRELKQELLKPELA